MAPKKGGQISRLEPEGVELLEAFPEILQKFKNVGWYEFCCTFQGYHEDISMIFSQNFDGYETILGNLLIHVTEHFIAAACRVSMYGERWWKKDKLPANLVNQFLVPEHHDPDWSQGIPHKWLKEEWKTALAIIQRYITCEGRFSTIHCYHIQLLMHLNGDNPMCLPFYLLKSLTKMSKRVYTHPKTASKSLFHQGLIKTLVLHALSEVQMSWNELLNSLRLEEQGSKQRNTPENKSTISKKEKECL
jgi:hypothetical protein